MVPTKHIYTAIVLYASYILSSHVLCDIVNTDDLDSNIQYLKTLNNAHKDLSSLHNTVSSLDRDLEDYQKRTCRFGLNSQHCALANLDSYMGSRDYLTSGYSPGKRSGNQIDPATLQKYQRIIEDLAMKRENLALLKSLLNDAKTDIIDKRKRTCHVNLGGSCATELASAIADQYYYLSGPNSPGRRKKRSVKPRISPLKLVVKTDLES